MNLYKIIKYLAFGFGIIGIILTFMIMSDNLGALDYILYLTYLILFIIIALVLIYVIKGVFAGNIKKTLLSLGLFLGVLIISYFLSSGTDLDLKPFNDKGLGITESISKNVGAGLYAFYILMFGAIVAMLVASTKKMFNR
ncbi:MAG TPA: hypothetical protein VKZ98_02565 [Aquaticitalea sp.]|nr:hypothetical protein [Aquaticitalea sp.]